MSTSERSNERAPASPLDWLDAIVDEWLSDVEARSSAGLRAALRFGSTVGPVLKEECDVDLMLVFETLPPDRDARREALRETESDLATRLEELAPRHRLEPSLHVRTVAEFERPSRLCWDMLHRVRVHRDREGLVVRQLARTRAWLEKAGAVRHERGLSWTWVFDRPELMELRSWDDPRLA